MLSPVAQSNAPKASTFTSFARATSARGWLTGVLVIGLWLAGSAAAVRGQSALDAFNPNADGTVRVVVVQPDGKILIGGGFSSLSPNGGATVTRNFIARLNPDGTLDTAFDPDADGQVGSIAVQADGMILVGGDFTNIGGEPRNFIARLDATSGAADMSFDPDADDSVRSIAVQTDGKILVGGDFTSIGGQTRNYIARLDATTGAAEMSFDPNANSTVFSIVVQADGKIIVGGDFQGATGISGQPRNFIARLNTDGTADSFNPNANTIVYSIAVQADGRVLAGGDFTTIGGQPRNRIARLEATTGAADSFNPNATGGFVISIASIAVQADGKILAGGIFTAIGGQPRNSIARLDPATGLADSFDPNMEPFTRVHSIAVQADGKILAGGDFTSLSPNGGAFVIRNRIARLETDGRLDRTLDLSTVGSYVLATAVQPDGKILIGGNFSQVLGVTRNHIARLNTDGTLDMAFNPNSNNIVNAIAVQADGKVLLGGEFFGANSIGGATRNYIARLDAITGAADVSFDPNANNFVYTIAVQADGKILAGGAFNGANSIGGATRNRIARLDATTGAADVSFNPNANSIVYTIAVQADGKILAGGDFNGANSIGGATRNGIARLDATTGAADVSFDPDANTTVYSIAVQADGKVLAGGDFTSIGVQPRSLFARLSNDTAALQNLAVTQTTISWTRGGSSPQFTRVTFEYSTDNVNYSPLGSGTASGSDWTRSGLSLSTGQNIYIRARGYYRSGSQNGSESITESVRNAFNPGPTATDATISGRILASDGTPIPGAIVNLTGSQTRKTITDASGNYRFDNVETSGFYTVTPSRANYSFGPASRSFSQLGNQTEAAFTGTPNSVVVGNSIDTAEYFVRQHYLDFLGREPDESGFNFWSDQIGSCGDDASCVERKLINVSAAYFLSIEFQRTGGLVDGLYRASFGRAPRYAEFMPDTAVLAKDVVVGRGDWQGQLAANKRTFIQSFVNRDGFRAAYDGLSNAGYVDALIGHTGVSFSGRDALVSSLDSGLSSRAEVLLRVAENDEFVRAKRNAAFVMMQYFGYLRRDPDDSGYQFWLNKLNQFDGNFERAEMVRAFLVSGEYRARFAR